MKTYILETIRARVTKFGISMSNRNRQSKLILEFTHAIFCSQKSNKIACLV